jgi:site-specific DNA recombinase
MIAVYMRVSTDRQDELSQIDKLTNAVKDFEDVRWYVDHGITGTKATYTNREQYMQMLEDARSGKIEHIYCFDWSRMWRNMVEQTRAADELLDLGILITSMLEGTVRTKDDLFMMHIHGAVNEQEARRTRLKSNEGIQAKHKQTAEAMCRALKEGLSYDDIPKKERWGNSQESRRRVK